MFKQFKEIWRAPSAAMLAQREYEDAQRSLLSAHSAVEYAKSMVAYHQARVDRLSTYPKAAK